MKTAKALGPDPPPPTAPHSQSDAPQSTTEAWHVSWQKHPKVIPLIPLMLQALGTCMHEINNSGRQHVVDLNFGQRTGVEFPLSGHAGTHEPGLLLVIGYSQTFTLVSFCERQSYTRRAVLQTLVHMHRYLRLHLHAPISYSRYEGHWGRIENLREGKHLTYMTLSTLNFRTTAQYSLFMHDCLLSTTGVGC